MLLPSCLFPTGACAGSPPRYEFVVSGAVTRASGAPVTSAPIQTSVFEPACPSIADSSPARATSQGTTGALGRFRLVHYVDRLDAACVRLLAALPIAALPIAALPIASARAPDVATLATVAADFDAWQRTYAKTRYDAAAAAYREVIAREGPAVLQEWARLGLAATALYLTTPTEARSSLAAIAAAADPALPLLEGRALWLTGTSLLRDGAHSQARAHFQRASERYARCGETGNVAATAYLQGETLLALGNHDEAGRALRSALRQFNARPPVMWQHNALIILGQLAGVHGLSRVAALVADEGVQVSSALSPIYRAEALLTRARHRPTGQEGDLDAAQRLLATLPDGTPKRWLGAQANTIRAAVLLQHGEFEAAVRDLRAAREILESERRRLSAERTRVQLVNSVRQTYEGLAAVLVASGDTLGALRSVEDVRATSPSSIARAARGLRDHGDVAVTCSMHGTRSTPGWRRGSSCASRDAAWSGTSWNS